ncbi:hypothetical protein C922_02985 [Plasmodium inui San Antonio 1]|uniref:RAP domain-containing protein n=1 Tax=Plasmodium inui San Antonio 1 TaxID=1237626 RepID=W7AC63_9APIC|nr:hypothetical protein C922_02985 [Plasmodium inui San Antonio 1]EUD66664.1 hypothetical protein C922_02985 [Plasmodium inui San Antonio 1]
MIVFTSLLWLVAYSIVLLSVSLAFIRQSHSVVAKSSSLKKAPGGKCYLLSSHVKRRTSHQLRPPNGDEDRCRRWYHIFYYPDHRGGNHYHGGDHHHGGNQHHRGNSEFVRKFNKRNCFLKPAIFSKSEQHKLWADVQDSFGQGVDHGMEEHVDRAATNRENHPVEEVGNTDGDDEFDLITDHILVRKNRKSIKELMEAGIWGAPKENLKMIRERTNKKINWNYILKKNNKLLSDNVDHIYNEIYSKENVDDIFFVFDTNPYSYLNITMSVFSLHKITTSYLNERRQRVGCSFRGKKVDVLPSSGQSKDPLRDDRPNDNFLTMDGGGEDTYGEVDDRNILKLKEERKRLNDITRNRNFMRIVGSINKHLKIIYKIFSTNEKLTTYEKNRDMYKFIPYINIKDIITILRCFSILKFDHTNIFKYIYFFLVFFMDQFDMYLLCEAVYLCLVKKIYVRPLFLNFSKRLLGYLQRGERGSNKGNITGSGTGSDTGRADPVMKDASNDGAIAADVASLSPYDEGNLEVFCRNMEQALQRDDPESDYFASSPFHMKHFSYSLYHNANYSSLNNSQDELEKGKQRKSDEVNRFAAQDLRHEKTEFIDSGKEQSKSKEPTEVTSPSTVDNRPICFPVYCLYTLCKFPYTNVQILNIITSQIMEKAPELSIEELILSFYSLAELEVDSPKLLNVLFLLIFKCLHFLDHRNNGLVTKLIRALYMVDGEISAPPGEEKRCEEVKTLMLHYLAKMVFHNRNNYTPIELVDIIRYMSGLAHIDKELFNFVYQMPFLQNLNQDTLDYYKNNVYFNQSYYAYTKDSSVNTPIEIMVCKLYQSYLAYRAWGVGSSETGCLQQEGASPQTGDIPALQAILVHNDKVKPFQYGPRLLQLLKQTYTNNMRISSYSSSSLHYEMADIIKKDLKIPCHVEYVTDKGLFIDIVILREDLLKFDASFSGLRNIAIEVNGPFHYKTKSYSGGIPHLNTKTVVKRRLLEHDNWHVISLPFWEVKPWFSKSRKENYILRVLPDELKSFFSDKVGAP